MPTKLISTDRINGATAAGNAMLIAVDAAAQRILLSVPTSASDITNDSTVSGSFVKDALNSLNANLNNIPPINVNGTPNTLVLRDGNGYIYAPGASFSSLHLNSKEDAVFGSQLVWGVGVGDFYTERSWNYPVDDVLNTSGNFLRLTTGASPQLYYGNVKASEIEYDFTVSSQTANYTLADTDYGSVIEFIGAGLTLTIPVESSLRTAFWCIIRQSDSNSTAFTGAYSVNGPATTATTAGAQWAEYRFEKTFNNTIILTPGA